ncbi:MAG TPA: hypothetical protein VG186_08220 [Solirubrobacteraceae bacterium]|nr:hypothetical protein [Solirubrobacteraceae bacterium]
MAISACGSSPLRAGATSTSLWIKYVACMRTHGVPGLPDPAAGGGGIQIPPGSGIDPSSPAFQSARKACVHLLPGGGPGAQRPSKQQLAEEVRLAQCMRRHGISEFPDPTLAAPATLAGYRSVEDLNGIVLVIPNTISEASPAFKEAAAACGYTH